MHFRFLFMWPNSRISVMGGEQAAMVLSTVTKNKMARSGQEMTPEMEEAIKAPIIERYQTLSWGYIIAGASGRTIVVADL